MDRASELRALMKAKSNGGISGKDKAKYLKTLREGKKEESAISRPAASTMAASLPTTSTAIASTEDSSVPAATVKQVKVFRIPSLTAASSSVVHSAAPIPLLSVNRSAASSIDSVAKLVTYDDDDDLENEGTAESIIPSSRIDILGAGPPAGFFDDADIVVSRPFSKSEPTEKKTSFAYDSASEALPTLPKRPTVNAADEYTGEVSNILSFTAVPEG